MPFTIIAAVSENGVIGSNREIPWKFIPEDMKRFRDLTMGHPVIMGRITYQSILKKNGEPLEGRRNIVLTRNKNFEDSRVLVVRDLEEIFSIENQSEDDIYVVGGAEVYRELIPLADRMKITRVHGIYRGDTHFPKFNKRLWEITEEEKRLGYSFETWERK